MIELEKVIKDVSKEYGISSKEVDFLLVSFLDALRSYSECLVSLGSVKIGTTLYEYIERSYSMSDSEIESFLRSHIDKYPYKVRGNSKELLSELKKRYMYLKYRRYDTMKKRKRKLRRMLSGSSNDNLSNDSKGSC
jgi:hypothetical protein